jgi:hypothetical protein
MVDRALLVDVVGVRVAKALAPLITDKEVLVVEEEQQVAPVALDQLAIQEVLDL